MLSKCEINSIECLPSSGYRIDLNAERDSRWPQRLVHMSYSVTASLSLSSRNAQLLMVGGMHTPYSSAVQECVHCFLCVWNNYQQPPTRSPSTAPTLTLHLASLCWCLETQPRGHVGSWLGVFPSLFLEPWAPSSWYSFHITGKSATLWLRSLLFSYTQIAPKVCSM